MTLLSNHILLIEDDAIDLALLENILDEFVSGEISCFSSSIEALAYIQSGKVERIDLLVCDWQMPEVNGIDILQQFRIHYPESPFLMVTANATKELVVDAMRLGATGFIAKPLVTAELTRKVSDILGITLDN